MSHVAEVARCFWVCGSDFRVIKIGGHHWGQGGHEAEHVVGITNKEGVTLGTKGAPLGDAARTIAHIQVLDNVQR